MDPFTENLENEFNRCSSLLRVQTFIKHLKREEMPSSILRLIATTFSAIERLKVIDTKIDVLNRAPQLIPDQKHKRELFQLIKGDLEHQIDESVQSLENRTHYLTNNSDLMSVAEDLGKATFIFRRKVISRTCEQSKKNDLNCAGKST